LADSTPLPNLLTNQVFNPKPILQIGKNGPFNFFCRNKVSEHDTFSP